MAFLCPAGFPGYRRRKRARSNVGGEKDNPQTETEFEPMKMVVVRDFIPCVDDELEVKRGQHVKALYQENEWRFVVADNGKEGFIPYTYCIPVTEQSNKPILRNGVESVSSFPPGSVTPELVKNVPNNASRENTQTYSGDDNSGPNFKNTCSQEFVKKHHGRYIVLFDYNALQEDDITTHRGEKVTVLNKDDIDWYWVIADDGREGFIPREYLQHVKSTVNSGTNQAIHHSTTNNPRYSMPAPLVEGHGMKSRVKQLRAICDFISRGKHELTVKKGERLFTDDSDIDKLSWIWVYSPQSKKRGFVPRTYVQRSMNSTFL